MPRRCCVPLCRSNYKGASEYTNVFTFPKDETLKAKWIGQIHRKDFNVTKSSVVCIKHFDESFIERNLTATRPDGSVISIPRKAPTLTKEAYPTIFENQPKYMTTKLPTKRKCPDVRANNIESRREQEFEQWFESDKITCFKTFKETMKDKLPNDWIVIPSETDIFIGLVDISASPKFIVAVKFSSDLSVCIWHNNLPVPNSQFEWLLGNDCKCELWSSFDCLISHLNGYDKNSNTFETKLKLLESLFNDCIEDCDDVLLLSKLQFLQEQIKLCRMAIPRYVPHMLLWASTFFFSHPSAYRAVRSSGKLVLPHPVYLKSLLQKIGSLQSGVQSTHIRYLSEKNKELSERERIVGLLMDEIYVKQGTFYKGGKIEGLSMNNNNIEATTLQAFLIDSIFSKNKDIVGLYPMKNQTSDDLFTVLKNVLQAVQMAGYKVLFIASDNNRINRKTFEKLCGGTLKCSIENPAAPEEQIFLLFDTVHLMKGIRNNWLNQLQSNQTFLIPPNPHLSSGSIPSSSQTISSTTMYASVLHLKKLYSEESNKILKLAPSLSRKALYPSNLERQSVGLALKLFDEKLVPALESMKNIIGQDVNGTIFFIDIISKWFKIVNVKTPHKGKHKRDIYCEPIYGSRNNQNIEFLEQFCIWLSQWENLPNPPFIEKCPRYGKLSKETYFALSHTTKTLIYMCRYIFETIDPPVKYILLGKFQTDSLESRFGLYRSMSGGNYNVSVVQVLESERKLKIMSLMKLQSAKLGSFNIKNFLEACEEDSKISPDDTDFFLEIIYLSETVEITQANMKVLIYISGYVARVASADCVFCKQSLTINKEMVCDVANEVQVYLVALDRGGLLWPNDYILSVCSIVFKIFQMCIGNDFEESFLKVNNQKALLIELVEEKLSDEGMNSNDVCSCNRTRKDLVHLCIKTMSNILLSNYCKTRNDKLQNKNAFKKKLMTLKK